MAKSKSEKAADKAKAKTAKEADRLAAQEAKEADQAESDDTEAALAATVNAADETQELPSIKEEAPAHVAKVKIPDEKDIQGRSLFYVGLKQACMFSSITLAGVEIPKTTTEAHGHGPETQHVTKIGRLMRLEKDQIDAVKKRASEKFQRSVWHDGRAVRAVLVDSKSKTFRPDLKDIPLSEFVYIIPYGELTPMYESQAEELPVLSEV